MADAEVEERHLCTCSRYHPGQCRNKGVPILLEGKPITPPHDNTAAQGRNDQADRGRGKSGGQGDRKGPRGHGHGRGYGRDAQRGRGTHGKRGQTNAIHATQAADVQPQVPTWNLTVAVNGTGTVQGMVDTGADFSIMRRRAADQVGVDKATIRDPQISLGTAKAGANFGKVLIAPMELEIAGRKVRHNVLLVEDLAFEMIIGRDLMHKLGGSIDVGRSVYRFADGTEVCLRNPEIFRAVPDARVVTATVIPPRGCVHVPLALDAEAVRLLLGEVTCVTLLGAAVTPS